MYKRGDQSDRQCLPFVKICLMLYFFRIMWYNIKDESHYF